LPPNLCYTIAFDLPGRNVHRRMARLLVTSLLLTGWHGRITVFKNFSKPVLPARHPAVQEIKVKANLTVAWHQKVSWKYRLRDRLDLSGMAKVLFLDCDCLALRGINQLMAGGWDIYTAPEPGRIVEPPFNGYLTRGEMTRLRNQPGLKSGNFGVRAARFLEVMAEWERIDATEPARSSKNRNQHSWNRLVLDTRLRRRPFAPGEIQFPFLHRATYGDYRRAAIIHAADRLPEEKLSFLYGMWMDVFGQDRFDEAVKL
jgi:hypothetical protein